MIDTCTKIKVINMVEKCGLSDTEGRLGFLDVAECSTVSEKELIFRERIDPAQIFRGCCPGMRTVNSS
jgi:hypothetical protein